MKLDSDVAAEALDLRPVFLNEPSQVSSRNPDVSVIMWQRICQLTAEQIDSITQHHDLIVFSISHHLTDQC